MTSEGMTEENNQRHESVLKLLPEDSVYILLWGEPHGDDRQYRMRALGNMAAEGQAKVILSYVEELIRSDPDGVVARMFRNVLTGQLESMVQDVILGKITEDTPHGGN